MDIHRSTFTDSERVEVRGLKYISKDLTIRIGEESMMSEI